MDLDIFTPEYKKEQKALEKAQEFLAKASKAPADKRQEAAGLYQDAFRFLESKRELFVQRRRGFSDCYVEIGVALQELGQKDDGLRALEAAMQVEPQNASAWAEVGKALQGQGRFEDAAGFFDRALLLAPSDADIWVAKGKAMRALMEYGEARMCYGKALQLEPLRIEFYEQLHEINPEDAEVLKGKGVALSLRGRHDEAAGAFREALELAPGNAGLLTETGKGLSRAGKPDEALALFDRALQSNPACKGAHIARARTLSEAGKHEEALKSYSAAMGVDPVDPEALFGAAEVLLALGRHREALDTLDRAMELAPRDPELLLRKGAALHLLGSFSDAARCYEQVITMAPDNARAWAGKGRNLLALGRHAEALPYLEKAALMDRANSIYANWMGRAQAALGQHEEAIISFNIALEHDQDLLEAVVARGESLLALGRVDEAIRAFNRASMLAPSDPSVWFGRAKCSMRQDRFEEALGYLDKALAIDPGYSPAKDLRALAVSLREKADLEGCARQVLDFEQRSDRMPNREEAFRDCQVPFEKLDRVLGHIGSNETLDILALSPSERDELDAQSSDLIRKVPPQKPIRLSDAVKLLPGASVIRGKRVLGYIEAVRAAPVLIENPLAPRTEERSRAGLHLPQEERDLFGLVRRLNLPLGEARRVEEVLKALKSGRPLPAPPVVGETSAAEVPESELVAAPDLRTPEKKPRKPRRKPAPGTAAPEAGGPEFSTDTAESKEPEEKEPETPVVPAEEEEDIPEAEDGAGEMEELGEKSARRPRKRKAPGEEPAAAGEPGEAGEDQKEGLDDQKIQDISESIKDIVTSIEKREKREVPDEKADGSGRRGRTYCTVCHSIIATIHHGCGAHLCSRCVIDFNKDRRAERNLCPKCLKPIDTVPPPAGARTGWRDTL